MSRPIPIEPLLRLLLETQERSAVLLEAIGLLKSYAEVNQDNETARKIIIERANELCHLGYQISRRADSGTKDPAIAAATDPAPLPMMASGPELDRLIYAGAMQHIADVSRFTGNLSRVSNPASRHKTAELLRDWADELSDRMTVEIDC